MRRSHRARLCVPLIVSSLSFGAAVVGPPRPARADGDSSRPAVAVEVGYEYDSNVHRTEVVAGAENVPVVGSPVARVVVSGSLADLVGDRQEIALSALAAGKLFTAPDARSEDVAVAQTTAAWRAAIGARSAVTLQGVYYDAFQRRSGDPAAAAERRDFRSITPLLRLEHRLGGDRHDVAIGASAGYRLFVFKSDLDFDFRAPLASVDLRWARESDDGGADWEIAAGSTLELRAFSGTALIDACGPTSTVGATCAPSPGTSQRRDTFLMSHVEIARTGAALIGLGYALHWNESNSIGETVTRHFATLRLTAPLPFGIYLAARAELSIASYLHPVIVGQTTTGGRTFVSIDDENRSSLRVDVSRSLGARLQLVARYSFYINEIGASAAAPQFRRQTALLSLRFAIGE
jgi:hypothetical protein